MGEALAVTAHLSHVLTCSNCGIIYAIAENFMRQRRQTGGSWQCPNGHGQSFTELEVDRLKKELEAERQRLAFAKREAEVAQQRARTAEADASTERAKAARLKRRIGAGVCPYCKRTFSQLARHMDCKHKDEKK